MRKFNLPLVAANLSVDTALKTAIDAKRSGVVLKTKSGGLRLVHYEDLHERPEPQSERRGVVELSVLRGVASPRLSRSRAM